MGFNGVSIKKLKILAFLLCRHYGVLVWSEMPSMYEFHEGVEALTKEWVKVIYRDYNHPSIIMVH